MKASLVMRKMVAKAVGRPMEKVATTIGRPTAVGKAGMATTARAGTAETATGEKKAPRVMVALLPAPAAARRQAPVATRQPAQAEAVIHLVLDPAVRHRAAALAAAILRASVVEVEGIKMAPMARGRLAPSGVWVRV